MKVCVKISYIAPWILSFLFTGMLQKYFRFISRPPQKSVPYSWVSKESACSAGDLGLIPGLGSYPGEGNSNPLQYSCLENPMDRGAWRATVHGVTRARLLSPGILQAGILKWVVIFFSRGSSWPRNRTRVSWVEPLPALQADSLLTQLQGKPQANGIHNNKRVNKKRTRILFKYVCMCVL